MALQSRFIRGWKQLSAYNKSDWQHANIFDK